MWDYRRKIAFSTVLFVPLFGQMEIPLFTSGSRIIYHHGYSLVYSEPYEQSQWVAYELRADEIGGSINRSDNYRLDPKVATSSASPIDYEHSGFDRGHLAPAADMAWDSIAMSESFYMSNISPQLPAFNRGIWKKLESVVRSWAEQNGSVFVATGGILEPNLESIGENRVSVPDYFYKVILVHQPPNSKAIGFILPNRDSEDSLVSYAISVDSVETRTGIDFFPSLPDSVENSIEVDFNINMWRFEP